MKPKTSPKRNKWYRLYRMRRYLLAQQINNQLKLFNQRFQKTLVYQFRHEIEVFVMIGCVFSLVGLFGISGPYSPDNTLYLLALLPSTVIAWLVAGYITLLGLNMQGKS